MPEETSRSESVELSWPRTVDRSAVAPEVTNPVVSTPIWRWLTVSRSPWACQPRSAPREEEVRATDIPDSVTSVRLVL